MAKYDDQLERMNFLMGYKVPVKESHSNIEYHANGADGKVYGILKEGTKYYIKQTESGKENIAESYDYIGGFVNKRDNEFTDYNKATKQLELKLMSLNEAYGKKEKTSTFDSKRTEKVFMNLTEEARKELDRMNEIFENSMNIGKNNVGDPESKGRSTAEQTEKNNEPFNDKVTPNMNYKGSKGSVKGSTEGDEISREAADKDLQSDKMKNANSNLDANGNDKNAKDAHDDLDGEGVADKKPSGGKVVKVNEDVFEGDACDLDAPEDDDISQDDFISDEPVDSEFNEINPEDLGTEPQPAQDGVGDDIAGFGGEDDVISDDEFESLLEELGSDVAGLPDDNVENLEEEDVITGPDKVLDKEGNSINGTNNGVDGETGEDWKRIEESEDGNVNDPAKEGDEDTLKNYQFGNNKEKKLPAQSWDKMNESVIKTITESIYKKLVKEHKKESLQEAVDRIVKEEVTKLDVWGKHPRYQKEPMTIPANKEVLAGTADRDFNDDSAKGERPYGQKIGSSAPFNEKVVDLLVDQVISKIRERQA